MGQFERGPAQSVKFGTQILTEAHINPLSGDLPKVGLVLRGQSSRKVISRGGTSVMPGLPVPNFNQDHIAQIWINSQQVGS